MPATNAGIGVSNLAGIQQYLKFKPMAVSFQCMTKFTTNKKKCTVLITSEVEYFYDLWYTNHLCLGSSFLICELPTFAHFPFKLSCACFSWNDCLYFVHQLLVSYVPWNIYSWLNLALYFLSFDEQNFLAFIYWLYFSAIISTLDDCVLRKCYVKEAHISFITVSFSYLSL